MTDYLSPMTTWLRGGRSRRCELRSIGAPQMKGAAVCLWLYERNERIATVQAPTVEEAMAKALNVLMAKEN